VQDPVCVEVGEVASATGEESLTSEPTLRAPDVGVLGVHRSAMRNRCT
jgi:hypothetical protein